MRLPYESLIEYLKRESFLKSQSNCDMHVIGTPWKKYWHDFASWPFGDSTRFDLERWIWDWTQCGLGLCNEMTKQMCPKSEAEFEALRLGAAWSWAVDLRLDAVWSRTLQCYPKFKSNLWSHLWIWRLDAFWSRLKQFCSRKSAKQEMLNYLFSKLDAIWSWAVDLRLELFDLGFCSSISEFC